MKTVKVNVYKFSELSEQAKEKARNWWREGGLNYEWWDYFYYDAEGKNVVLADDKRLQHICMNKEEALAVASAILKLFKEN